MDQRLDFLNRTELFVLDMDGTFYLGEQILPGALDFLDAVRECGKDFCFSPTTPPRILRITSKSWQA